jgi:predicted helicase
MSQLLIANYIREIEKYIQYGGDKKETSIRRAFANLLSAYCKPHDLLLVDEIEYPTKTGTLVYPDGTIKDALRLTHGYWEAKDQYDDIDVEIEKKLKKGYPSDNILFEDSITAVLLQNGSECLRAEMRNSEQLDKLIRRFVEFERPELQSFRLAIDQFKHDLPEVLDALRDLISTQLKINKAFKAKLNSFLKLCQDSINKTIVLDDVREMLIQHILTEDIFYTVFNDTQFHRENNIARELQKVADTFFIGTTKKNTLKRLESYYGAIKQSASGIANHHEKQKFLKAIYENFYKIYNPKMADRLGVVYTPNEIVRFMIESTESLVHKHFKKLLSSKGVEILDPATGTGTFITDLIEHFKGDKKALEYKYKNELHCNEVAILPYYIANLNIEFTYSQIMGEYAEFPHICFVDTLDNLGFAQTHTGAQDGFDFGMTAENTERVKKQNAKKISVVIGNPPYNANQLNENDNNKNRTYDGIDKRIKDTYIHESTAQKTKLYDMYARFLRWASDRLDENGVVAFVSNSSFINSRTYDGFRKCVAEEFNEIYIVDMKGNARTSGERRKQEAGNVFDDQIRVGISVYFLVKNKAKNGCKIFYNCVDDYLDSKDKIAYLATNKLDDLSFQNITPDKNNNWINLADNDFDSLIPVANKETKAAKTQGKENAIFKLFSLGVVTARDEWVYDNDIRNVEKKIKFLINAYNRDVRKLSIKSHKIDISDDLDYDIKWSRAVKNDLSQGKQYIFDSELIRSSLYRPYVKKHLYFSKQLNEMQYQLDRFYPTHSIDNIAIGISGSSSAKPFQSLAVSDIPCYDALEKTQYLALYQYDKNNNRIENITDWGLTQFTAHYGKLKIPITKQAIFHYVYAVLHDPIYREKYTLNLKREFPRIPFYADFWLWASWGKALMDAHIGYESAKPTKLKRVDQAIKNPKAKLKADRENGLIILDGATTLSGVPTAAWDYKLGNRSALEWVLDQYKESKPKDPTIREKFNTYRFADYKEHAIDLLARVCTVSVETQKIVGEMKNLPR